MTNQATQRQIAAADPRRSTWLTANAGSGKTRVLTNRVARLLFDGVDPQNILCLTYTKAAAGEMQNRLFQTLGGWAMLGDDALRAELTKLGVDGDLSTERLSQARRLFASAIETPGGLKIQTIHSFCGSLLRRFPMEAGVSPEFIEMDDVSAAQMRSELLDAMADGPEADLVRRVMEMDTSSDPSGLTAAILENADRFRRLVTDAELAEAVGLDPSFDMAAEMARITGPGFADDLRIARDAMASSAKVTDQKRAAKLAVLLERPDALSLPDLAGALLNQNGTMPKAMATKDMVTAHPDAVQFLVDLAETVSGLLDQHRMTEVVRRSRILHDFAHAFVARVDAHKLARGLLGFDDLIQRARALLEDERVAQWVLWRLDGGLDHILVDEAQDTSPDQWAVVRRLTEQFGAGAGARADQHRTIFVVGDRKQSIYSFQGADPDEFDRMQSHFDELALAIGEPLQTASLQHSFRSSRAVLGTVDQVFTGDASDGLEQEVAHLAFFDSLPGRVDLWPTVVEEPADDVIDDWTAPTDKLRPRDAVYQQAEQVAQRIKRMVTQESLPVRQSDGTMGSRPIHEGDILILMRSRKVLFNAILRACKAQGLRMAGSDRISLLDELAVKDLLALLSFLSMPDDDLALASALRSPLFGWTENDLFRLAQPRGKGSPLWRAMRENRENYAETVSVLDDLRGLVEYLRPYDLLSRILIRHDGRQKLLSRLGLEAEEAIDALLAQAMAYEQTEVPSLTGFLGWLSRESVEIKRQAEGKGDALRVMTVHGSKGLEAPIVILPDCGDHRAPPQGAMVVSDDTVLWRPRKEDSPGSLLAMSDDAQAAEERESRRLLYVAMTRAESWLIVGGTKEVKDGSSSWYALVEAGMADAPEVLDAVGPIRRVSHGDWPGDHAGAERGPDVLPDIPELPALPRVADSLNLLTPSKLPGAKALPGEYGAEVDPDRPMARGSALHLLLEMLPEVPEADRATVAARLVADDPEALDLTRIAIGLITRDDLAPMFRDGLKEVSVSAQIEDHRLDGTIDLLLVEPDKVTAIDYKSNRVVPERPEDTPLGVAAQLGAYAKALGQIYPGRSVETAILWTETGTLMPVPHHIVCDALEASLRLDLSGADA